MRRLGAIEGDGGHAGNRAPKARSGGQTAQILRRRDLANVSNATASTMMTPMTICWM